jgi:hypothetical protein
MTAHTIHPRHLAARLRRHARGLARLADAGPRAPHVAPAALRAMADANRQAAAVLERALPADPVAVDVLDATLADPLVAIAADAGARLRAQLDALPGDQRAGVLAWGDYALSGADPIAAALLDDVLAGTLAIVGWTPADGPQFHFTAAADQEPQP